LITGNLSFGNVTVNQQAQRTLSITNLDSESHSLAFAIGTGFSVAFSPFPYDLMGNPVILPAGGTVNATVTFSPTSVQSQGGNLSITSATLGNRTIPASGTATHSRIIGVTGNFSFGSLTVNQTASSILSIRNTGTGTLNVTGISYPSGLSGNWSVGTIAANATQNITVSFRPATEGSVNGNITVSSNATSGNPSIAASGIGTPSRIIGVTGNLSFGSIGVNATANRTLSIKNTGTGILTVNSISYPPGFSGNFSGIINPNATQNVTVSFCPATVGNFNGNITVNSTATSGNAAIAISGTAMALPVITTTNLHGTKGLSFSQRILSTNNATSFGNATALPVGLTINRTTGLISGTMPTGPLTFFSANITATSAFGTTTAPVTFWFWDDLLSVAGGSLKTNNGLNNRLVPTFRIGKYEVTWFEWKAVREWAVANGYTDLADVGAGSGDLHPVTNVNWYDVAKWCNAKSERDGLTPVYQVGGAVYKTGQIVPTVNSAAKGYRLPMEAEWDWAARGGVSSGNYTYSGSNDVNAVAWYASNSVGGTKQFATKQANDLGIHDMSGNVEEWCWDSVSSDRRIRGGSWSSSAALCTVASRGIRTPDSRSGDSGLRLARSSDEPTSVYGIVGLPVSYQLTAANTPSSFGNATALPAGLSLNATTGLISGTPMTDGNSTVTLRATNAGFTGTANVTFSIKPDLITVEGGTLPQVSALWGTYVSTFRIGTFEVTRSLWQIVRTWGVANGYSDLPSINPGSSGSCPVQQVSWYDAVKWCNARSAMESLTPVYTVNGTVYKTGVKDPAQNTAATGYRLPTEAEWEWAARGGVSSKGYTYSGGNDLNAVGWYWDNSFGSAFGSVRLWSVGQKPSNELGIFDASGNVKEWCWDAWNDGGKVSCWQRGGSWSAPANQCAFTHRGGSPDPQGLYDDIGFRLARKAP
jgi:formylglycine-generating enzyme required for sulfatase activity